MTADPTRIPAAAVEAYGRAYDAAFLRLGGYTGAELARAETEGIRAGLAAAAPWLAAQALRDAANDSDGAGFFIDRDVARWLNERADELERQAVTDG